MGRLALLALTLLAVALFCDVASAQPEDGEAPASGEHGDEVVREEEDQAPEGADATPPPEPVGIGHGPDGSSDIHAASEVHLVHERLDEGAPEELKPDGFDGFVRENAASVVLLTGDRCHLCKRINKEFKRAEWLARGVELQVRFGKVDAETTEGTELLKRLNVGALPAMFLYRDHGKQSIYIEEWWAAEPLVADIQLKMEHFADVIEPVRELDTVEDAPSFLFDRANDQGTFTTTAVIFLPHTEVPEKALEAKMIGCNEDFANAARDLAHDEATAFRNRPRFARVFRPEIVTAFGLPLREPSVVVYKDFDEGKAVFAGECGGDSDPAGITEFIRAESTPRAVVVNHGNIRDHLARKTGIIHVFVPSQTLDDPRTSAPVLEQLQELMKRLETGGMVERAEFIAFLSNGHQYRSWLKDYGLPLGTLPAVGIDIPERKRRFALPRLASAKDDIAENTTMQADDAKPDPETGLLPDLPFAPDSQVELDLDEIARGLEDVLERRVAATVVYGKKKRGSKKDAAAKKRKKPAKKGQAGPKGDEL